jgi:hypothetical protein
MIHCVHFYFLQAGQAGRKEGWKEGMRVVEGRKEGRRGYEGKKTVEGRGGR